MTARAQDDAGIVAAVEAYATIENEARSSMDSHGLYAEEAAAARAALFAAIDVWAEVKCMARVSAAMDEHQKALTAAGLPRAPVREWTDAELLRGVTKAGAP